MEQVMEYKEGNMTIKKYDKIKHMITDPKN